MDDKKVCPLCKEKCNSLKRLDADKYSVGCQKCGEFDITVSAYAICEHLALEKQYLLSGVTRRTYESIGQRFLITQNMITDDDVFDAEIRSIAPRSVAEKLNLLLQYLGHKSKYISDAIDINHYRDYPVCFCKNPEEFMFYIKHLKESGLLEHTGSRTGEMAVRVTVPGWAEIKRLSQPNMESKQAFVAMWFSDEVGEAFTKGIAPLKEDTGFSMMRVDMQEYNDKICDRIIAEIKKSRFLIVDVTGHRHAVYFEAGYAMGMGLPVIWTCREDHKPNCHQIFDTRQYNHIFWKTPDELREKLRDRILATIR